uniref:Deoxyhypusine synthase n=1 Tax=Lates calcarifer TaxID=8187 RepID=A0A4W6DWX1_LATCA
MVWLFSDNMAHHTHRTVRYIYRKTVPIPEDTPKVQGYDFNQGVDHRALLQSYLNTGFQATNVGLAIQEINNMVRWVVHRENFYKSPCSIHQPARASRSCTIFLSYTSNLISSGVRETICYLAEHRMWLLW